jgi:hypothetical protein
MVHFPFFNLFNTNLLGNLKTLESFWRNTTSKEK